MKSKENCKICGFIYSHAIYNDRLILLVNVDLDVYNEELLMEKSLLIGGEEFNELVSDLKIGDTMQYDLNKLDGIGIYAEIIRQPDGIHTVGRITLDEEYWQYCRSRDDLELHRQYCQEMRNNTHE